MSSFFEYDSKSQGCLEEKRALRERVRGEVILVEDVIHAAGEGDAVLGLVPAAAQGGPNADIEAAYQQMIG